MASYGGSMGKQQDADLGLSESFQGHPAPPRTSPGQGLGDIELERGAIPVSPVWSPVDGLPRGPKCQFREGRSAKGGHPSSSRKRSDPTHKPFTSAPLKEAIQREKPDRGCFTQGLPLPAAASGLWGGIIFTWSAQEGVVGLLEAC